MSHKKLLESSVHNSSQTIKDKRKRHSHACEAKGTDVAPCRKKLSLQCAGFHPLEEHRRKYIADHLGEAKEKENSSG